jgi:hypothetical protein
MIRNLGSEQRVTDKLSRNKRYVCWYRRATPPGSVASLLSRRTGRSTLMAILLLALQSAVLAQPKPSGLAAQEPLLIKAFFGLLAAFVALVAWEVLDNKKASRSSLDIAKLAAAAAKKQSAASAPSGSLANLEAPPTSRPFAPPPPPPPPKQPAPPELVASMEQASPFAPPSPPADVNNPFAAPPAEMLGAGALGSTESTVAFNPTNDAGSSGGWADLLQRVRAGEPEAASFEASPPPLTEDESFVLPPTTPDPGNLSPASSSEAWEALLKRTTTGEPKSGAPKAPQGDVGKISLASNFQLPGETPVAPSPFGAAPPSPFGTEPAAPPFGGAPSPFGSSEEPSPIAPNVFGSFEDGGATFQTPAPGFPPLASSTPPASEPAAPLGGGMGFSFSSDPASEPASPFGGFAGGGFGSAPAVPGAGSSGGFESPSFKLPGSPPADDFGGGGSGGFQLPGSAASAPGGFGGAANPFDFGGAAGTENPSSSTLPLSDLFSKPAGGAPPAFQLPSGGGPLEFGGGLDSDAANPGLGRTISLDFAKGGGQKPPPPLPKTEG